MTGADVEGSTLNAFEATAATATASRTQAELHVVRRTWLKRKKIGKVKFASKATGLHYFEPTSTVVRQGHLMPVKGNMELPANVLLDILTGR